MKKVLGLWPFLIFILLLDRLFFLPGRMDATWEFENGNDMGNPITFENIDIVSNFEIQIQKTGETKSCYLLGCYFGNLYLLDTQSLKYTRYSELEEIDYTH